MLHVGFFFGLFFDPEDGGALLATCFTLASSLAYLFDLNTEATYSSKMSVDFEETTQHYISEERAVQYSSKVTCGFIYLNLTINNARNAYT
jgi:hypothetical protein